MSKNNSENNTGRIKLTCWSLVSAFSGTYAVFLDMPDGTKMTDEMHNRVRKSVLWHSRRRYKEKGNPIIEIEDRGWNYKEKMYYYSLVRKSDMY